MNDKSHLSEWKGKEDGLDHDVQRLGAENDTVLSPKTEETQLAALSSKYYALNTFLRTTKQFLNADGK
jgi:hypothetical protein